MVQDLSLNDDLETISIYGNEDARLKIALLIQKGYPKPIRLIDSEYSFDLVLEKIESVGELRQKMLKVSSVKLAI